MIFYYSISYYTKPHSVTNVATRPSACTTLSTRFVPGGDHFMTTSFTSWADILEDFMFHVSFLKTLFSWYGFVTCFRDNCVGLFLRFCALAYQSVGFWRSSALAYQSARLWISTPRRSSDLCVWGRCLMMFKHNIEALSFLLSLHPKRGKQKHGKCVAISSCMPVDCGLSCEWPRMYIPMPEPSDFANVFSRSCAREWFRLPTHLAVCILAFRFLPEQAHGWACQTLSGKGGSY